MPKHVEADFEHVGRLIDGGGLKEQTLRVRKKMAQDFDSYAQESQGMSITDLLLDITKLEKALIGFFETLRVSQRQEDGTMVDVVPKRNTIDSYKSQLKQHILSESENKLDITSASG